MKKFEPKPQINLHEIVQEPPFEEPAARNFLKKWCAVNDSIVPRFISRQEWENRQDKNFLEERPDSAKTLVLPKDIKLWEMIAVVEEIDRDTFKNNPQKSIEKKKELIELGELFQKTGAYFAKRVGKIYYGKELAEDMAKEFFNYGGELRFGQEAAKEDSLEKIASFNITKKDTEEIDRWLAGDELYESRRKRAEEEASKNPENKTKIFEKWREDTLKQFFVLEKRALEREAKESPKNPLLKKFRFETAFGSFTFHAFLERIRSRTRRTIEKPLGELYGAIYRRGVQKLVEGMAGIGFNKETKEFFREFGLDLEGEQKKLIQLLEAQSVRKQIEELRRQKNFDATAKKEIVFVQRVHEAINKFPYHPDANNPSEMVRNRTLSCAGVSILGGAILREAGISYLAGTVPEHAFVFMITSNQKVYLVNFVSDEIDLQKITNKELKGTPDGKVFRVKDIVNFSKKPNPEGLIFEARVPRYYDIFHWVGRSKHQFITVFPPEIGEQLIILNSSGLAFEDAGMKEEALYTYSQAVKFNPKDTDLYNNLGFLLEELGNHNEAVKLFKRSLKINPEIITTYLYLGEVLNSLLRHKEAISVFQRGMGVDKYESYLYYGIGNSFMGIKKNNLALLAFKTFLELSTNNEDDRGWKDNAKRIIKKLSGEDFQEEVAEEKSRL